MTKGEEKSVIIMTDQTERTIGKKWFNQAANLALGVFFAFVFSIWMAAPVEAGNQQITFQGKLTNSSGNTVSDGTYYLKLTIYNAASGGTCQYTASSTCASVTSTPVTVTSGIFSINLGDTSASLAAISSTLFSNSELYLGITVCSGAGTGCDSEMTPRKRLTAAPYAFNADYLSGLATSTIGGAGSYVPVTDSSGNLKITNSLFVATTTAGQFGVGTTTVPSGMKSYVEGTTASDKLLVLRGNSSQSGNLQEWQNSAGKPLGYFDSSGYLYIGDGSTSSTLQKDLLRVAFSSTDTMGKFYVDSSGNVSASGTLTVFDTTTLNGGITLGDTVADRITVNGILGTINISNGTTATTTISRNSLTLGIASDYNSGVFNIDSTGAVNASGTITTASTIVSTGITISGSITITGANGMSNQGNTTLGNSDNAGGDWTRIYGALSMGATPTGNAQMYLAATSTIAVPFLIHDTNSKIIAQMSSSSAEGLSNGAQVTVTDYSLLTVGDAAGLTGAVSIRSNRSSGALVIYRNATAIGTQLSAGTLIMSGDGSVTSTLGNSTFTLSQDSTANSGKFYIDNSGNTSSSGTWQVFGGASTGGLKVSASNTTTTITSLVSGAGAGAFVLNTNTSLAVASSSVLLSVRNNGSKVFSVDATGYVTATGTIQANNTSPGPGDVAEYVTLTAGETTEAGDVLIVDENGLNQYRKSDTAYAKNVAGVISGTGAFLIGGSGPNRAPLALAGLVKVKVTDENGPIVVGDYLATASKPGYAMRFDIDAGASAGLVGMALEPLAEGEGKILILINKGLVAGLSGAVGSLNVNIDENGQLKQIDLDMIGQSIFNVLSIKSKDNKWMIDEDGYLIAKVATKQGDKKLYGLQSGQDKELVLSGSAQLENGMKKIELPVLDQEVIDPTAPIKVSVTLTGEAKGVFVSEKNYQGFTVKELSGGTSNATFDWLVIAKRRPADYVEPAVTEPESVPVEAPALVIPVTASSTPGEELAPTLIGTSTTTSINIITEEVLINTAEQVGAPVGTPSTSSSIVFPAE